MKTAEYVGKFRLDQENYQFSREEFLAELNNEFLATVSYSQNLSKETQDGFSYQKFKNCIKEVETKFWAISNKKVGEPLTDKLWSAFFAIYVIPVRARLFPKIEQEITDKRNNYLISKGITPESDKDVIDAVKAYNKSGKKLNRAGVNLEKITRKNGENKKNN